MASRTDQKDANRGPQFATRLASRGNPFVSGSPVRGDQFGDRRAETDFLARRMRLGQNVFVMSPRRFGKTSLLLRANEETRRSGGRVAMANLFYCASRREVAEQLTRSVIDGALGWLQGTLQDVKERLSRLPGVSPSIEHGGWKISLSVSPAGDDFAQEIRRPVELLAEAARRGLPVALVIDEFQQVVDIDDGLPGVFKAISDDLPEVSLVFAGSRKHVMQRLFVGRGAPLQNAAEMLSLGVIEEREMVSFLRARAFRGGRTITLGAAVDAYRLMRGIPHFVQLLASSAFDRDEEPIDELVVKRALVDVLSRQHGELAIRYESLNSTQRRLLRALAGHPTRHLDAREVLERMGLAKSSAHRARDGLDEVEHIILDERFGWRVADPIFELWVQHGLELDLGERLDPAVLWGGRQ